MWWNLNHEWYLCQSHVQTCSYLIFTIQYPVPLFSLCTIKITDCRRPSPLFLNAQKKIISTCWLVAQLGIGDWIGDEVRLMKSSASEPGLTDSRKMEVDTRKRRWCPQFTGFPLFFFIFIFLSSLSFFFRYRHNSSALRHKFSSLFEANYGKYLRILTFII